jgi:hypothetical protein
VMTTNTHYEDEANPCYSIGPITGEAPGKILVPSSTKSEYSAKSTRSANSNVDEDGDDGKKTWAAGTGRMFDPDRWLDEDGSFDPNAGPSLPFSLGQRGCFGKSLAVSLATLQSLDLVRKTKLTFS